MSEPEEEEHEMEACYAGGHGDPYYQPHISCSCRKFSAREETWEEVGALYDEHLRSLKEAAK